MKIDVVGRRKIWFGISITLVVVAILASFVFGVKLDINFRGGTILTYSFNEAGAPDKDGFLQTAIEAAGQDASVQEQSDVTTGSMTYVVTLASKNGITPEQQDAITTALTQAYPDNGVAILSVSNVDASIGNDFLLKSLVAVALAAVLMIVYIAFRFRKMNGLSAGVISVIALLHDVIVAYGAFIICGFAINDSFIAVVLTILGYSINNTIIIYDRIRENRRLMPVKTSFAELVNTSVSQSLARSINTTVSTVLAMLVVCIVSMVFNVQSILTFALPMLVGLFSGFFSSVFLSGSLWAWWQEHKLAAKKAA